MLIGSCKSIIPDRADGMLLIRKFICLHKVSLCGCLFVLMGMTGASGMIAGDVVSNCDQTSGWTGGVLDGALKQEGTASLKWSHGTNAQLIHQVALDLSDARGLSFWMHSNIANG